MRKWFWICWTSVISWLENSAYKITPLEGKNAQPGFTCSFFYKYLEFGGFLMSITPIKFSVDNLIFFCIHILIKYTFISNIRCGMSKLFLVECLNLKLIFSACLKLPLWSSPNEVFYRRRDDLRALIVVSLILCTWLSAQPNGISSSTLSKGSNAS